MRSLISGKARLRRDALSPTQGQAIDMIAGAMSNIRKMVAGIEGPVALVLFHQFHASNTVNIWIIRRPMQGSSIYAGSAQSSAFGCGLCWLTLRQISRQ